MTFLNQVRERSTTRSLQDRLVWQSASLLLAYPDEQHAERLAPDGPAVVLTSSRSVSSFRRRLTANPAWRFIPKSELSGKTLAAAVGG